MNNPEQFQKNLEKMLQRFMQASKPGGSGGGDMPRPNFRGGAGTASRVAGLLLLGSGLFYGVYNGIYSVDAGHKAVKYNRVWGILDQTYDEGIHFAWPWLERPIIYDVRTRPNQIQSMTGSRDLQIVNLTVRVLHRPDSKLLPLMYRELGINYAERVLPSIGNEVLKSVVAQFTAAELLTKRNVTRDQILQSLTSRARDFGIVIDDVSITHLEFGKEYSAAVEAKQVAQQEAERAKFVVQKAEQEKKSMVLRAQGEAEAIRLVSEAMATSRGFIDLRRIEAAKEIASVVSNAQNKIYLSSDTLLVSTMSAVQPTVKKD